MKKLLFTIILCALYNALHAVEILPTDANIQYIGRPDMTNPAAPIFSWPGTEINISFEGTSLQMKMSSTFETYYMVQVDSSVSKIVLSSGSNIYTLASGLTDGDHTARIIKVTDPWIPQTFESLILDDGKTLLTPPARKARKIEFYGDSQTQGAQTEVSGLQTDGSDKLKNNSYLSYASITARALNAEYVLIAKSGATLMPKTNQTDIPSVYDRTGMGTQYSLWDFSAWTPDVVCINLGVNDSPLADPANFTAIYVDFVKNKLRVKYPNAHIFLLSGPMNNNATLEGAINSTVTQLNTDGDNKVYYFKPSQYIPHSGHPRTVDNVYFAQELAAFITTKTWTTPLTGLTPEEVYITPFNTPLALNTQRQLTAVYSPFDASNDGFTWTSLNPDIATVDITGVVTGVSTGTAKIIATASNGAKSYDYELDVSEVTGNMILNPGFEEDLTNWGGWGNNATINTTTVRTGLKSLELSPTSGVRTQIILSPVEPNTTYTFSAWFKINSGTPAAGLAINYTLLDGSTQWLSSNITISNQFEQKAYTFTTPADVFGITAIIQLNSSGALIVDDVELVKGDSPSPSGPVTGVSISGCPGDLAIGSTHQFTASVSPINTNDPSVFWSSSNENVATVNATTGMVSAHAEGTATIKVTTNDGGFTDSCIVTVSPKSPNLIDNGDFSNGNLNWNLSIISPSTGSLDTLAGEAKITITNDDGTNWHISFNQSNLTLENGKEYTLSFDARAESNRNIGGQIKKGGTNVIYSNFSLTPDMQTYSVVFTNNEATGSDYALMFFLGAAGLNDVWFDNIELIDNTPTTTYSLIANASTGGSVSPANGTYADGTVVALTATPEAGYKFSGWSGDLSGTNNPADITMDADKSVTANFVPIPTYTLTTSAINGSIALNPEGGTYYEGTVVTLTATPDAGYVFTGWSGDLSGTTTPTTITMDAARNVTAIFDVQTVAVTGVNINEQSIVLTIGNTHQLTATVSPENATNKTINWSSSDTTIASINAEGLIMGMSSGEAMIYAETQNGGFKGSCQIMIEAGNGLESNATKHYPKIYPNPASDKLYIETANTEPSLVNIFNLNGQLIYSEKAHSSKVAIYMEDLNLSSEMIIVQVISDQNVFINKVIID